MSKYPAWVVSWLLKHKTHSLRADFGEYYHTRELLWLDYEDMFDRTDEQQKQRLLELINRACEVTKAWREGRNYDTVPKKLYHVKKGGKLKNIRERFFKIYNSFAVVNQTVYEALKDCHLGRSSLTEVYIYDPDTDKQVFDIPYYFLNLAERREFVDIQNSQGIRAGFYTPESPDRYLDSPSNGDIILSPEVHDVDVDIWHDPRVDESIFFSDRAIKALRKHNIRFKKIDVVGCRTL